MKYRDNTNFHKRKICQINTKTTNDNESYDKTTDRN